MRGEEKNASHAWPRLILFLLISFALAACGSSPKRASESAAGKTGKGYYLDDGPGDNPPPNLDLLPDAKPRAEPLNKYANRPYTVLGKTFVPETRLVPYKARGIASWYGRKFHGQKTSSGEPYDMYAMTAAHPTLPIPSYARVTSLRNSKSVIVRINDRGPFYAGRVIDLSYAAAYKLGITALGSSWVEVESVMPGMETLVAQAPKPVEPAAPPPAPAQVLPAAADSSGIYLQLGAFSSQGNAEQFLARLRSQLAGLSETLSIFTRDGLFRVHAGPYANRNDAQQAAEKIGEALGFKPLLLVR
ncbi:MAG TPA: septal ring lytic transglycosylase RlpA family protein [Burkholderiales bacterium]|nr:septal ring lytic transglycosylase RlpA family protein [Burkholderiales bacterium]